MDRGHGWNIFVFQTEDDNFLNEGNKEPEAEVCLGVVACGKGMSLSFPSPGLNELRARTLRRQWAMERGPSLWHRATATPLG